MRDALTSVDITEIKTDIDNRSVSFVAPSGMDIDAELNKLVENSPKLKDWSKSE